MSYARIISAHVFFHTYFLLYLVPPDDGSDELNESQKIICINKVHKLTVESMYEI